MKIDCLILAGGLNKKGIGDKKTKYKSLIEIDNRPLINYTLEQVLKCKNVSQIVLAAPKQDFPFQNPRFKYLKCSEVMDCVLKAAKKVNTDYFLIMIGDAPLVKAQMIDDLIYKSLAMKADFCTVVIEKKYFDQKYPRQTKPFIAIKEGVFGSHFNFFIVGKKLINNQTIFNKFKKIYEIRKNRLALASLLGPEVLNYFLFNIWPIKKDTLAISSKKLTQITGFKFTVVKLAYPELAMDIDTQKDFEYINQVILSRKERYAKYANRPKRITKIRFDKSG